MSVRQEQAQALEAALADIEQRLRELTVEASQCGFPIAVDCLRAALDQVGVARYDFEQEASR